MEEEQKRSSSLSYFTFDTLKNRRSQWACSVVPTMRGGSDVSKRKTNHRTAKIPPSSWNSRSLLTKSVTNRPANPFLNNDKCENKFTKY